MITTYALMLIYNLCKDVNTSKVCKQIITKGSFAKEINFMSIDKSVFLLDFLEIGRRNIPTLIVFVIFLSYSKLAQYRYNVNIINELVFIHNEMNISIFVVASYERIRYNSLICLFETFPPLSDSQFPHHQNC